MSIGMSLSTMIFIIGLMIVVFIGFPIFVVINAIYDGIEVTKACRLGAGAFLILLAVLIL